MRSVEFGMSMFKITSDMIDAMRIALHEKDVEIASLRSALEMISAETKLSNEQIGRSIYKALATCGEIADIALSYGVVKEKGND